MLAGMGPIYAKLVASGSVDDRTALMLFLLVEKLRGEVSQPYRSCSGDAYMQVLLIVPHLRRAELQDQATPFQVQRRSPCYRLG